MARSTMPKAVKGNVRLTGYMDMPDLRRTAILVALKKHVELTRAEEGCIYFSVEQAHDNSSRLVVSEIFENQKAFDHHQRRTAASAWGEVTKGIQRHFTLEDVK